MTKKARTIDATQEFAELPREFLIAMIITLRAQLSEAQSSGLVIKGWWCSCEVFNGEEYEPRFTCRSCGHAKKGQASS